jgi:hypothetical protein
MQSLGSALVSKFDFIDFSFHENDMLFELVDSKNLILRLSPNNMIRLTRFRKGYEIKQVIVGSNTMLPS